jgi:hypothetical protein
MQRAGEESSAAPCTQAGNPNEPPRPVAKLLVQPRERGSALAMLAVAALRTSVRTAVQMARYLAVCTRKAVVKLSGSASAS